MDEGESRTWTEEHFTSEGVECAARVYRPAAPADTAAPVVVLAHGFGDSAGEPRQLLDVGMQLADWRAALAFARTLPGVDPQRVVAWGTSFAGGHVITLAGAGEPLVAIIAQVPHVSGPAAVRATGLLPSLRVGMVGLRDQLSAWAGRAPVYVDSVAAPGQTGVMTTPDAAPGMARLIEESGLRAGAYPENVAARITLKIGFYSPGRSAAKVACPALVQIVEDDTVTPERVAKAAASKMPRSTVRTYPGGHFDPYVTPLFDRVIADQIEFLRAQVPLGPRPQGATS